MPWRIISTLGVPGCCFIPERVSYFRNRHRCPEVPRLFNFSSHSTNRQTDLTSPTMAFPRRTSLARSKSEDDVAVDKGSAPSSLAPPRPFFLAGSASDRSSANTETTQEPASDSDKEANAEREANAAVNLPARVSPRPIPHNPPPPRPHRRRSAMASPGYTPVDAPSPDELWSPTSTPVLRAPPSSFAFPFQAYPGNPDPGLSIPGVSRRRSSLDSTAVPPTIDLKDEAFGPGPRSGSLQDLRRPYVPFMGVNGTLSHSPSTNSFYKNSPAGKLTDSPGIGGPLPRISSTHSFRAPFLSPASRPSSSLWSPPAYTTQFTPSQNFDPSLPALPLEASKSKPPLPSTRLHTPLPKSEKPWLAKREPRACTSYFITLLFIIIGIGAAGYICFVGVKSVHLLSPSQLCMVLDEQFTGGSLDASSWSQDVSLGGFGNGEFEMMTDSSDNLYFNNDQLYIYPTLTTDTVSNVLDGGNYTLDGCTDQGNNSACSVASNAQLGTVINPVMSARINTQGKVNITYGKVEFRAKLPRGYVCISFHPT